VLYPHTTGAYLNGSDGWNRSAILKQICNIPECFSEELYRYADDPLAVQNLAQDPKYKPIKDALKRSIPKTWQDTTGGRLEVPHDSEKVMRPHSPWDHLPPNS